MEQALFAPSDLAAMVRLQIGGYDFMSECDAVNICQRKHYETKMAMESLKHLNVQPRILKNFRKVKLRRLDEYKHAFIQFLSKRLSLSRNSPQISFHKMEHNVKDANVITNGLNKRTECNIPIIQHDAIYYDKTIESYSISSYSQMMKCFWLGTKVTVRKMLPDKTNKAGLNTLKPEVHVLGQIRHPYILLLLAMTYDDKHNLMLLYENVDHGSLFVYLHEELRSLSEDFMLSVLDQMARVFIFLHQNRWIHTNLTSHSIQIMSHNRVKLSCFELATSLHSKTETNPQSSMIRNHLYNWQAPEYYAGWSLGEHTDIFQFGLLTWEISQREIPWIGLSYKDVKETYLLHKKVVTLTNAKTMPQLIKIMDQSLNITPEERQLNFNGALKLINSAKVSTCDDQNYMLSPSNKETHKQCKSDFIQEHLSTNSQHHNSDKEIIPKAIVHCPEKRPHSNKSFDRKQELHPQEGNTQETVKDPVDSFTGLRRVSESNFKTFYALSPQENLRKFSSFSSGKESTCCHSSLKSVTDEPKYTGSTGHQKGMTTSKVYYKDNSSCNYLISMASSMKSLPLKSSIKSSSGIKPASHSLEKQLSSSNSQDISWSCGSSTPYRALAIKPASHQSQRGFTRSHPKTTSNLNQVLTSTDSNSVSPTRNSYNEEYHGNSMRRVPHFSFEKKKEELNDNLQHISMHTSKITKPICEIFSSYGEYPPLLATGKGGHSEEVTTNEGDNNRTWTQKCQFMTSNQDKDVTSNFCNDGGPEVITKICQQLLNMIKDPYVVKKENESPGISLNGMESRNQKNRDCYIKIPGMTELYVQKKPDETLRQPKRPSSKFLKILGLNLMEFYQDDELGPSLWNDENMQLGMYQEFGKSIESLLTIEEFYSDNHNDLIPRGEDVDMESDPELKNKCKFNALYYTLNQKVDEDCCSRKE